MKQENAENFLNNYSILENRRDKHNAGIVVDFVSNTNVEVFLKILKESDRVTEKMKVLIALKIRNLCLTIENKNAEIERLKRQSQEVQQ